MILDSHCHAWTYWPYQPPVPDPIWRGRAEQLLHEMDGNGVDQALVVCTQIENNPDNNAYIADQVAQYPGRLHQLADLDSEWSQTYHTSGSADRLRQMAARWPLRGFTHQTRYFAGIENWFAVSGFSKPASERSSGSWRSLLGHYKNQILACDFFTVETIWLKTIDVLFFIELGVHLAGCTTNPHTTWVTPQTR